MSSTKKKPPVRNDIRMKRRASAPPQHAFRGFFAVPAAGARVAAAAASAAARPSSTTSIRSASDSDRAASVARMRLLRRSTPSTAVCANTANLEREKVVTDRWSCVSKDPTDASVFASSRTRPWISHSSSPWWCSSSPTRKSVWSPCGTSACPQPGPCMWCPSSPWSCSPAARRSAAVKSASSRRQSACFTLVGASAPSRPMPGSSTSHTKVPSSRSTPTWPPCAILTRAFTWPP
mmetsp:Transcript_23087/g.80483  ORF Transcript_23087/g.80483 Transcript_23087/m.80483 type:complete len:235 (+) Transcript_23087:1286-1990(+)